jgi:hypothetical protein
MSKMRDGEITSLHFLAISGQLVFVRSPLLVFDRALSPALLALRDADESVDDADEKERASDATADGVLGGVGEACPLLFGLLLSGKFVQSFVYFRFAPDDLLVDVVFTM